MRRKTPLKQLERRLSTRRIHLIREIEQRFRESRNSGGHRFTDIADMASNISRDELLRLVLEAERRELAQIDEAMERIRSGNYGICKDCGQPIKKERLEALPFATLCVKCKAVEEAEEELESRTGEAEESLRGETVGNMENDEAEVKTRKVKEKIRDIEASDSYSHN